MEAVIELGGKQYVISEGDFIRTDKIDEVKEGEEIEVKQVLAIIGDKDVILGKPYVEGASVLLRKMKDEKGKKIIVFKFKRKKRYRRKYGHRQWSSLLKVEKINWRTP